MKIKLSNYIEAFLISQVEFLAVLFPKCGISYVDTNEVKGYQGINIRWKLSNKSQESI